MFSFEWHAPKGTFGSVCLRVCGYHVQNLRIIMRIRKSQNLFFSGKFLFSREIQAWVQLTIITIDHDVILLYANIWIAHKQNCQCGNWTAQVCGCGADADADIRIAIRVHLWTCRYLKPKKFYWYSSQKDRQQLTHDTIHQFYSNFLTHFKHSSSPRMP